MSLDRQKVIDTAQKFAAKGQFDKAIAEYMRVVKEDPSDVRILLKIGDLQVRKGAKDDAIATYSRVARGYDEQGFYLKAIAVYKQILSIDPNLTDLYSKLAELYVKLGLIPDALSHLDALATRFVRAGQDDRLAAIYRQMVDIDGSNVPSRIKLAELLSKLNRADEAAREFEAGARLLKEANRLDDWAKVSERLLFHRPNDLETAKHLAAHYLERQDAKRALPKLQVCFKANPKDVDTLELLAAAFRELGQLPKTISVLKEVARIHQDAGRHEKRAETYRKVLELAPNDTEAKEALRGASRVGKRPAAPEPTAKPAAPPAPEPEVVAAEEEDVVVVEDDAVEAAESVPPPAAAVPQPQIPPAGRVPSPARQGMQALTPVREPTGPRMAVPTPAPIATQPPRVAPPPATAAPVARVPAPTQAPVATQAPRVVDVGVEVGKIIAEADIFIKYGLKPKAVLHLQKALELDETSVEALLRLRDLYVDIGDVASSVQASLNIATLYADNDPNVALGEVTRALELDPSNEQAHALYQQLGGALDVQEQYAQDAYPQEQYAQGAYAQQGYVEDPYAGVQDDPNAAYAQQQQGYAQDPYAADPYAQPQSYAQDPYAADPYAGAQEYPQEAYGQEQYEQPQEQAPAAVGGRDIEDGLDEAEFFVTQGLYDDARETLQSLLNQHPNHPLVLERWEELHGLIQAQTMTQDDQSFALAEKLAEEVNQAEQSGGAQVAAGGEMIDVETVFAQFKKGLDKVVSPDDADTHFDLGTAYKEMGLLEDAITEFRISAQNPRKACIAETMVGICHMERGDVGAAIEWFRHALSQPDKSAREELGLYFELGAAYETAGDLSEALACFQHVERSDPSFRGVRARIQRVTSLMHSGTRAQPQSSVDLDEVDRAFDDLLKG